MFSGIRNRLIAWYSRVSLETLKDTKRLSELWIHATKTNLNAEPSPRMHVAKNAICLFATRDLEVTDQLGLPVKLIVGQKLWCLDGVYYSAEDVSFRGMYRVRRGRVALRAVDILLGIRALKIVPLSHTEVRDIPVEVVGA